MNESINHQHFIYSHQSMQFQLPMIGCSMNKYRGLAHSDFVKVFQTKSKNRPNSGPQIFSNFPGNHSQSPPSFQLAGAPFLNNKAKPSITFRSWVSIFPAAFVKALAVEYLMSNIWLNDRTSYCYPKTDAAQSASCHSFQLTQMDKCLLNTHFL